MARIAMFMRSRRTCRRASIRANGKIRWSSIRTDISTHPQATGPAEAKAKTLGFAKCPFDKTSFAVSDGRKAEITNSAFGTAFGVVEGKPLPVCDHAGYAPFGFGYRRCPGEQLSIEVFGDFLRKVWADKIEFEQLDVANPSKVPIGPVTVIDDVIGFRRRL